MAGQQWPLPEPHKRWLLKSDLRKKALIESGLIKRWLSGPKLDKKPELNKKWLLGPGPLEPLPLGMKCKPWFKDRDKLPSCYFSRQNNKLGKCPTSMDSRRWVFVKEGVDDFRTGCPSTEDVIIRGPREGFLPMIAHRIPRPPPKKFHRQPPKGADLCSKLSLAQQARKAFVENIEASLTQHPLANCPNLEEDLPPDLLLKVLEVLDPDRELEDTWAYCEGAKERKKAPTHPCEEHPEEVNLQPPGALNLEPPQAANLEPPGALNLEPPQAVNLEPPGALNLEPPQAANLEPPGALNLEPPQAANLEPPGALNLEPPQAVNLEPPGALNLEPPQAANLEPPGALNLEPPQAVNLEPPGALNLEPPQAANLEPPGALNLEPPQAANLEPPGALNLEPPQAANLEPPGALNLEPPQAVNLESPWKLKLEPPEEEPEEQAHVETAKESLLSYLFSLFPKEDTNAASTTDIPKDPVFQKARRTIREFCRWIDDKFGDIGIDEESIMKKFEIDFEGPLTHNTVKIKKINQLPSNIRPCKQLDEIKQRKFSLQEDDWERKLRKQQDPYKPKREKIRYGAWYLDPKCWKKLVNDQPFPNPKAVHDREYWTYRRHLEPDVIDELYGPIAFKDFIVSKGYKMPSVIEKMFLRKGWKYESVKTPIHRVMKLLSKPKEDDSGDEEN
ncbi:protein FAM47E-like [Myotis daubentonii]|uniref:protein FAM47E-like n=1 Tax=Myotis daubentonii TaxID=98922 RepID=UPI00287314D9|nr:protein FAM47E-like [Myotis daubentonii]